MSYNIKRPQNNSDVGELFGNPDVIPYMIEKGIDNITKGNVSLWLCEELGVKYLAFVSYSTEMYRYYYDINILVMNTNTYSPSTSRQMRHVKTPKSVDIYVYNENYGDLTVSSVTSSMSCRIEELLNTIRTSRQPCDYEAQFRNLMRNYRVYIDIHGAEMNFHYMLYQGSGIIKTYQEKLSDYPLENLRAYLINNGIILPFKIIDDNKESLIFRDNNDLLNATLAYYNKTTRKNLTDAELKLKSCKNYLDYLLKGEGLLDECFGNISSLEIPYYDVESDLVKIKSSYLSAFTLDTETFLRHLKYLNIRLRRLENKQSDENITLGIYNETYKLIYDENIKDYIVEIGCQGFYIGHLNEVAKEINAHKSK